MRRVGVLTVLIVTTLVGVACSSNKGRGDSSRPTASPPTSPAPSTTSTTLAPNAPGTTSVPADLANLAINLTPVASGLSSPVAIAWRANDPRPYVAEQGGRLRVIGTDGQVAPKELLRIRVSHGNEQGLLGIAFSPDGTKLYVDYTDPEGDSHVDEYTMRGDTPTDRRELLFQKQPFVNHNGGEVTVGPDGMLYIGFGDGGSGGDPNGNGQNLGTWLGKILRIDPHPAAGAPYTVPADNPFVGRSGARPEIWMYGLRNPWRFSFDRATGDAWIGDVGQGLYEEVDYARAGDTGVNWGWNAREGAHDYKGGTRPSNARDPIIETTHSDGYCAIVGGYVYRGRAMPQARGLYFYGDNCNPALTAAVVRNGKLVEQSDVGRTPNITTFGEDQQGELYAVTRSGGVFRLTAG